MKKVLLSISGGNSFRDNGQLVRYYQDFDVDYVHEDKYWMNWLMWSFEDVCDAMRLKMPSTDNAQYDVWKIVFEKYLSKFQNRNVSLVAHSLGTTFILKYLLENNLYLKELHLVAPFVSDSFQSSDFNESTGTFTFKHEQVKNISSKCEKVYIWYSADDTVCTDTHAKFLHKEIPHSKLITVPGRGHFNQSVFWEIFEVIKRDL